jgi:hypothetical protein
MFKRMIISLNNRLTRLRSPHVRPDQRLLLAPRCLQQSDCPHNIGKNMDGCELCGRCNVKDLVELGRETGVCCYIAAGGREALAAVKNPAVQAVVAVACEKELFEGIVASIPKPVLAVYNRQTNGPCRNTRLDIHEVRTAVQSMLLCCSGRPL